MDRQEQPVRFLDHLRQRDWPVVLGYVLFVLLMTAGYYYNITFVQLGLIDLGTRHVGLSEAAVSGWMAAMALLTVVVAVAAGVTLDRRGWSTDLRTKLRILLGVLLVQFALTAVAPGIRSVAAFGVWIGLASVALGVGFPVSFSLAVDLVPVPDRGPVAAAITALTYFAANALPLSWSIEVFSTVMVAAMLPGLLALAVLVSDRIPALAAVLDRLETRHRDVGAGRFCRPDPLGTRSLAFWWPVLLMFGVFFIDSLGFLRIIDTPGLVLTSWQSPELSTRLVIAVAHVVGAVMAGVIYVNFDLRALFLSIFALFALSHVLYTTDIRLAGLFPTVARDSPSILDPVYYSVAVSFYTTLNFALWPDLSTPETVGTRSAIGIGVAGWLATFLSTAVALFLQSAEYTLLSHLNIVNALALLLLFGLAVAIYGRGLVAAAREGVPE